MDEILNFPRTLLASLLLLLPFPASAVVEIARNGQQPAAIEDVYWRDGNSFVAIDEVLAALAMEGRWDPVRHVYQIKAAGGTATLSPGSPYLRAGGRFIPLDSPPRFLDGRLLVSEAFITTQLPMLVGEPIYYRDLNPPEFTPAANADESPLDRLFAFLLRKNRPEAEGPALRGIALDPGHGGQEPGSLSAEGDQEKTVVLEVARRLEKLIKMRLGIPVYLSRDGDYALSPEQRLQPAARPDTDALILLHAQAALSPVPRGVTLFVRQREEAEGGSPVAGEGESMRLALHLEGAFREKGFAVAGVLRAPLPHLGRGDLPAVLVELGYLSNPDDRTLLASSAGRESLAEALYAGLKAFANEEKEVIQ